MERSRLILQNLFCQISKKVLARLALFLQHLQNCSLRLPFYRLPNHLEANYPAFGALDELLHLFPTQFQLVLGTKECFHLFRGEGQVALAQLEHAAFGAPAVYRGKFKRAAGGEDDMQGARKVIEKPVQ